VAYGARLESVLGATPRGFESRILRHKLALKGITARTVECTRALIGTLCSALDFVRVLR
jgi:hypothetical protein